VSGRSLGIDRGDASDGVQTRRIVLCIPSPLRNTHLRRGITNIRTFVNPDDPTNVVLLMDVPDMDAFASVMQSEAAGQAVEHDGVLPETLVILVEE
jgi:hypothetical protein